MYCWLLSHVDPSLEPYDIWLCSRNCQIPTHTHRYTNTHTHMHTRTHILMYTCIHTQTQSVHVPTHIHTSTYSLEGVAQCFDFYLFTLFFSLAVHIATSVNLWGLLADLTRAPLSWSLGFVWDGLSEHSAAAGLHLLIMYSLVDDDSVVEKDT